MENIENKPIPSIYYPSKDKLIWPDWIHIIIPPVLLTIIEEYATGNYIDFIKTHPHVIHWISNLSKGTLMPDARNEWDIMDIQPPKI